MTAPAFSRVNAGAVMFHPRDLCWHPFRRGSVIRGCLLRRTVTRIVALCEGSMVPASGRPTSPRTWRCWWCSRRRTRRGPHPPPPSSMITGDERRLPVQIGLQIPNFTSPDVLSGGRAWLGIGAAWNEEEVGRAGHPVPTGGRAVRAAGRDPADHAP